MSIIFSDSFSDTAGTTLPAHVPDTGSGWSKLWGNSTIGISGTNKARITATTSTYDASAYKANGTLPNDAEVQVTVRFASNEDNLIGVIARNYYVQWFQSSGLLRINGALGTPGINTATPTLNTDYVIRVRVVGSSIKVWLDGTLQHDITDSSNTSGDWGIQIQNQNASTADTIGGLVDAFTIDDLVLVAGTPDYRTLTTPDGAIIAGSTDVSLLVPLPNTTTHTSGGVKLAYTRTGAAAVTGTAVVITPTGTHTDWGIVPIDSTNLPELHRVDLPDAAFAAGARELTLTVSSTAMPAQSFKYRLQQPTSVIGSVVASPAPSTTKFGTSLGTAGNSQLSRRLLEFTTGACAGQRVAVIANTAGVVEVAPPLTVAPAADDQFMLL